MRQLTDEKRALVSAAVAEAERKTSGEIIPVVVARAAAYPMALAWVALLLCSLFVTVCWMTFQGFAIVELGWEQQVRVRYDLPWIVATIAFAFGAAWAIGRFAPRILRPFVSSHEANQAAQRAASDSFFRFRLTRTRARTAVLICVCLYERRVVVLGDEAIASRLEQSDWDGVRDAILKGLATNDLTQGLVDGIAKAGELLARNFPADADNPDEVTNELRVFA